MLELWHVSFQVTDNKACQEIIKDLSMCIEDDKFVVITGPNGGGKSTLAKLIMGIEKPTGGQILWNGIDITDMSIAKRAKLQIGYAFQQPPRFKGLKVKDLLSIAHGSELAEEKCCSYLTDVGLCSKDYLDRDVDASLSGGEVKRIEIASLLARQDLKLAIFDAPEAGIALWSFAKLVETFQKLKEQSLKSIILISHQERIMELADEIIVIDNGKVKERGSKAEILPHLMEQFSDNCAFKK